MISYPSSLDTLTNPTTNDFLNSPNHVQQHSDANDAIEALESKLGIGASTPASGKLLRGTGAGSSAWDKDAPTGDIVGTSDSQTLTNKTLTSPTINTPTINNPTLNTNTIAEYTGGNGVTIDGLNIKDAALNTSNSVPNSALSNTGSFGSAWAWTSWTPTLTNLSGGAITYAKYIQIGKIVHFRFRYTLAGAGVSGIPRFTLPVTPAADYGTGDQETISASVVLRDEGTGDYLGFVTFGATGTLDIYCQIVSSTYNAYAAISSTIPFTWANTDKITVAGHYEAA